MYRRAQSRTDHRRWVPPMRKLSSIPATLPMLRAFGLKNHGPQSLIWTTEPPSSAPDYGCLTPPLKVWFRILRAVWSQRPLRTWRAPQDGVSVHFSRRVEWGSRIHHERQLALLFTEGLSLSCGRMGWFEVIIFSFMWRLHFIGFLCRYVLLHFFSVVMASSFFTKTTSVTRGWTSWTCFRTPHTEKSLATSSSVTWGCTSLSL